MRSAFLLLAHVAVILMTDSVHAEILPLESEQTSSRKQSNESLFGCNTQLKPDQHALVSNEETWKKAWAVHEGTIEPSPIPAIDFDKQSVVLIVEKADSPFSRISVISYLVDDEIVSIDYTQTHDERHSGGQAKNVFAFFVIPKPQHELVIRALGKEDTTREVARIPVRQERARISQQQLMHVDRALNIVFAFDPRNGNYDGAIGKPTHLWNFVSLGTTAKDYMRLADSTSSTSKLRVSQHDGVWGIEGNKGIFHGYIYHNCQCVDLKTSVLDLPEGEYMAFVYAHGDAPNQNAKIELLVGDKTIDTKATSKKDNGEFRKTPLQEGVQYVTFKFEVKPGQTVDFISHRDGSNYSMFNAIQIVPLVRTSVEPRDVR